ncbi:VOC family protein [Rhodopila sp.]|uniref:VOC family protein n=1 Tax=Rhodopila sp. TaxID=2480087 RepID=UPI003D107434
MLDHVTLGVSDLEASKTFYDPILLILGVARLYREGKNFAGYGIGRKAFFWIGVKQPPITGMHVAFAAENRRLVDAFHAIALANGGRDNGKPGTRPQYHADYYGAFILDPDGHNIEAVCHNPSGATT